MVGRRIAIVICLFCLLICAVVMAAVPGKISYQGRLLEDGVSVEGNVDMHFSLYTAPGALSPEWEESQYLVPVTGGIYNVLLGDSLLIPASVFDGSSTYLEVTVNGEVLAPRVQLTSTGYALHAGNADLLGGHLPTYYYPVTGGIIYGDVQVDGTIGLSTSPEPGTGIVNDYIWAPYSGARLYGTEKGVYGGWADNPWSNYGELGKEHWAVHGRSGEGTDTTYKTGGFFEAYSGGAATGVSTYANSTGTDRAWALYATAEASGRGEAISGYFYTESSGSGPHYGIVVESPDYAAYLKGGKVHIGYSDSEDYVSGDGDLYVGNILEVDGPAYFSGGIVALGAIDSSDVSFNYAGSSSKGGMANDSDLLDGLHAAAFALSTHTHAFSQITGTVTDAQVPDNITINLSQDSDKLDGQHGSYYQNASNINSGILSNSLFSAYSDLGAEGYLDNSAPGDMITQSQGDGRYVKKWETWASDLTVTGDATINGGNLGLGTAANSTYGIINNGTSGIPTYGANLYGSSMGVVGVWSGSPLYNVGYLGSQDIGASGWAGNSSETRTQSGGLFAASSQGIVYGADGQAMGYGSNTAYGIHGIAWNFASGTAIGGYFNAPDNGTGYHYGVQSIASGTNNLVAGINSVGYSYGSGTTYGGSFSTADSGTGTHYGIYTQGQGNSTSATYGIYADSTNIATGTVYGGNFNSSGGSGLHYGVSGKATGSSSDTYGVYGEARNITSGNSYAGYFSNTGTVGNMYGVYATADTYPGYFAWKSDPYDHYTYFQNGYYGIYVNSGNTDETHDNYGAYLAANSQYWAEGLYAYGYSTGADGSSAMGIEGDGYNSGSGSAYAGSFYSDNWGSGDSYGVNSNAAGVAGHSAYALYAYAYGASNNYGLWVAAGNKSWVNPDPEDATRSIAYVTVEAGENLTFCRGTAKLVNGSATITLPDHFRKVTSPDHPITVQATPSAPDSLGLAVVEKTNSEIRVVELYNGHGDYEFDYTVQGVRLGYEDYEPIIDNVDYVPFQGNQKNLDQSQTTTQEWYDRQSEGLKKIFKQNGTLDKDGKVNEKTFKDKSWKLVKEKTSK